MFKRYTCLLILLISFFSLSAQECRAKFEKLYNERITFKGAANRVNHFKLSYEYQYFDKKTPPEKATGDLYMGATIQAFQNDKVEIFVGRNTQVYVNKRSGILVLSNVSSNEHQISAIKMTQRKVFIDSSDIRMVKDTVIDNNKVDYFILKPNRRIGKISKIRKIEYCFNSDNGSVYKIDIFYNNTSKVSVYELKFNQVDFYKSSVIEERIMSKYFTKSGAIRSDFKGFKIVDNRR
jgi:hypothetical protein